MVNAPIQPDYSKYEAITKAAHPREVSRFALGLDDVLAREWAKHTEAHPTEQGKGLGDALYNAADTYVRNQIYGNETLTNQRAKRVLDSAIQEAIGLTRTELIDTYKDQKEVHFKATEKHREKMSEAITGSLNQDLERQLNDLKETDLDSFRDYIISLADKCGLKIKKEQMPRLSTAKEMYGKIVLPRYNDYLMQQESLEAQNKSLEKMGNKA